MGKALISKLEKFYRARVTEGDALVGREEKGERVVRAEALAWRQEFGLGRRKRLLYWRIFQTTGSQKQAPRDG